MSSSQISGPPKSSVPPKATKSLVLGLTLVSGALLYLSFAFAAFSALPIAYSWFRNGRHWGLLAALVNGILVWGIAGPSNGLVFLVLGSFLGMILGECAKQRFSMTLTTCVGFFALVILSSLILLAQWHLHGLNPMDWLSSALNQFMDRLSADLVKYKDSGNFTPEKYAELESLFSDRQGMQDRLTLEVPGYVGIAILMTIWANYFLWLKMNFGMVREYLGLGADFFKRIKIPDWLVWPTILFGALVVFEVPKVDVVALTFFKLLLALYCVQGLAILNCIFDIWGIGKMARPVMYMAVMLLMMPLVISLGFFDLWFSFRERLIVRNHLK